MKLLGLVLSVISVLAATGGVLLDKTARDKTNPRVRATLIAIAALVGAISLGLLAVGYLDSRASARQKAADADATERQKQVIEDIHGIVISTDAKVGVIAAGLTAPVDRIGVELVAATGTWNAGMTEVLKGDTAHWREFADRPPPPPGTTYLRLQKNKTYVRGLVLAYLWVTPANRDVLDQALHRQIEKLPDPLLLAALGIPEPAIEYVVLFDGDTPLGYWRARELVGDVLAGPFEFHATDHLAPGFHPVVDTAADARAVVAQMIQAKQPEALVVANSRLRHVTLVDQIALATP